ncbi:hypothetical protein SLS60_011718 [Paraconiothyrium brasiliense]|uniref:Clr5 domain-containing protein n=1 Tax=Paraconiothyrium brasiliense TaxID=300254 RepID=A0ABR3QII3_9PLEO
MDQSHPNTWPNSAARLEAASRKTAQSRGKPPAAVSKSRRHRHTEQEWNQLREFITQVYVEEDKKAEEVVEILSTQHDFKVGLRKLKDWLKNNGISKNVHKSDMLVLYAKRQARLIAGGKQTIVYKDGRAIDDSRLDRFGERYCLSVGSSSYAEATTPHGYTYATPGPMITEDGCSDSSRASLLELFSTERNMQVVFGHVPDPEDQVYSMSHIHQTGVFGLRITEGSQPSDELPLILCKCLLLARDLMSVVTFSATDHGPETLDNQALQESSPKFYITFTGNPNDMFFAPIQDKVLNFMKTSQICSQLLQLNAQDEKRWKEGFVPMAPEEQNEARSIFDTFLGLPSEFNDAMTFMHVNVQMTSPETPAAILLMRLSIGLDTREFADCETCQRRVVSIDCISQTMAVQVNVPLRPSWVGGWEPAQIFTSYNTEFVKWSECVYSLRGWFVHLSSLLHWMNANSREEDTEDVLEEVDNVIWEEAWDPMDVCAPLTTFQPHHISVPANLSAYDDFDIAIPEHMGQENSVQFDPEAVDEDIWDP